MKKILLVILNVVFFAFIAFILLDFYSESFNSEVDIECDYNYVIESNSMTLHCTVEDKDSIISTEHPLEIHLLDHTNEIVSTISLEKGDNTLVFDQLDYNEQYTVTIKGYEVTNEEYSSIDFDTYAFSTVTENLTLPIISISDEVIFDTEYRFLLSVIDPDETLESVDITLYDSSDNQVDKDHFTDGNSVLIYYTNLDEDSDYSIEIDIHYMINDHNQKDQTSDTISLRTLALMTSPEAIIDNVINNNLSLSFDVLQEDHEASDVTYTVALLNDEDTILATKEVDSVQMSFDVSDIDENYTILLFSSYQFKGDSVTNEELDSYTIYNNALSNFFLLPSVDVVNIEEDLENYDDYDDYIFTYINQGYTEFTVYCIESLDCTTLIEDETYRSIPLEVSHFVHVYYDIKNLSYAYSPSEINVTIEYEYTSTEMNQINDSVQSILNSIITEEMTEYDRILAVHDYVVNHTVYDTACANDINTCDNDHNALGVFQDGNAVCDGYASAMDIMLRSLHIPSIRISSDTHQWNAVYYDQAWYHLDATWDDPVTSNGTNVLQHDYFLITSLELSNLDESTTHDYDDERYTTFIE